MTATDFEAFVEREADRLRILAMSLTGNRADADDLLQETFTKSFVSWRKVAAAATPSAYVRQMMVHTFLSGKRRRSASEVVTEIDDDRLSRSDPAEVYVQRHSLLAMVGTLPERQRAIVVLRFLEDLPVSEVATVMRMRESAVRTACSRALATLRTRPPDGDHRESTTPITRTSYAT